MAVRRRRPARTSTTVENCGNTLILRSSASEHGGTAQFAARRIAEWQVLRERVSQSRDAGLFTQERRSVSGSIEPVLEHAVLACEIEQLPDLQGYLKLASRPTGRRVKLAVS